MAAPKRGSVRSRAKTVTSQLKKGPAPTRSQNRGGDKLQRAGDTGRTRTLTGKTPSQIAARKGTVSDPDSKVAQKKRTDLTKSRMKATRSAQNSAVKKAAASEAAKKTVAKAAAKIAGKTAGIGAAAVKLARDAQKAEKAGTRKAVEKATGKKLSA